MMRSMYSGVSGLRIHQTKMDVIGNNIANVNTVGFKSSRVTFGEVFSQTIQSATGANENTGGTNPLQIGLGATISSIDVDMGEGASQRTDNPLDLAISGDGFFVVSDATGNKFTRAGAFRLDETGTLVTSDGMNVMGWQPDETTGEISKNNVSKLQILSADNLYSEPTATSAVTVSGNVNKNDTQLLTSNGGVPFTTNVYDSLGYSYTVEMNLVRTPGDAAAGTDDVYTVSVAGITDENNEDITYEFLKSVTGEGDATVTSTDSTLSQIIEFDTSGKITTPTSLALTGLSSTFSEFEDPIAIDISSVTLFSGNTTIEAVAGDDSGLNAGNKAGSISGYEVGTDGQVLGKYTNGESKLLGQIVIATFKNPSGLQKVGDNLFETTNNSGEFDGIGEDVTSSGGGFNAGVLEMSNVDLSTEFTEMITTQRGFQANSRVITTSDEILQELVNLK